jgi:hypothetical protein
LESNGQTCLFDEYIFTPNAKVIPNVTYKTSNGKTAAVFETVIPGFGFVVEVETLKGGDPPAAPLINGELSFPVSARDRGTAYATVTLVSAGGS